MCRCVIVLVCPECFELFGFLGIAGGAGKKAGGPVVWCAGDNTSPKNSADLVWTDTKTGVCTLVGALKSPGQYVQAS